MGAAHQLPSLCPKTVAETEGKPFPTILINNINGIQSRSQRQKINLLKDLAEKQNAIAITITESHLKPAIENSEVHIENFTIFRSDRQERNKGGVINYLRDDIALNTKQILAYSNKFVEILALQLESQNTLLVTIYRPPQCPPHKFKDALEKLEEVITREVIL